MSEVAKVFIASSGERLDVAYAVQENLQSYAEAVVWNQGPFRLSRYALETLFDTLDTYHFGIFIFTPDDIINTRGTDVSIPRDNIVFEFGLFLGRHGRERCFIIQPAGTPDLHLPTDVAGITTASYIPRAEEDLKAALGPACNRIQQQIRRIVQRPDGPKIATATENDDDPYVAVLCYRLGSGGLEVLLVRTTGGRWTLPKGRLSTGETKVDAAKRYARTKAGVVGTVDPEPLVRTKHFKSSTGEIRPLTTFLLRVDSPVPLFQSFRAPQWFKLPDAASALSERRDPTYAGESAAALKKAAERLKAQRLG